LEWSLGSLKEIVETAPAADMAGIVLLTFRDPRRCSLDTLYPLESGRNPELDTRARMERDLSTILYAVAGRFVH